MHGLWRPSQINPASKPSTSIATLAAIVRMMYGMARDRQLPGSQYLTRLSGRAQEPIICIVVAALLSMVPLLFVQQIPVLIAAKLIAP